MPKLLIVANKTPVRPLRTATGWRVERGEGGLVSALTPILQEQGGVWYGNDTTPEIGWQAIQKRIGFEVIPVSIPADVQAPFYNGFCNATLWPLFHDFLGKGGFELAWWKAYQQANQIFADAIAPNTTNTTIWIQDYHFFLLPELLRQRGVRRFIRFFLHIPFPAYELFRHIPWRSELLRGVMECDEIGFHTALFRDSFLETVAKLWGRQYVDGDTVIHPGSGRRCQVRVLPISVDTLTLAANGEKIETLQRAGELRQQGRSIILGVDRLDYTKGLRERFLAFQIYLEQHPEQLGKVQMIQVAVPSRGEVDEYGKHKRHIEEVISRVNGQFGTVDWTPIRYVHRHVSPLELTALYKVADVALVTPLGDGMNLVAKEYVAVKAGEPGVLILSEFAGAADELGAALLVNPHHVEAVAEAIHRALCMSSQERRARMTTMFLHLKVHNIHAWVAEALAPPNDIAARAS